MFEMINSWKHLLEIEKSNQNVIQCNQLYYLKKKKKNWNSYTAY